jgi:hypothetical protein
MFYYRGDLQMKKLVVIAVVVLGLSFNANAEYKVANYDALGGLIGTMFAKSKAKKDAKEAAEKAAAEYDPEMDCYIQRLTFLDGAVLAQSYGAIGNEESAIHYGKIAMDAADIFDAVGCEPQIYMAVESKANVKRYISAGKRFNKVLEEVNGSGITEKKANLYIKIINKSWVIS